MSVRGDIRRSIGGTARERAGRELRNRILTGVFLPGDRLDIDAISIEFATSRTPVREALLELSYEGLVRVEARSGVTIVGLSRHDRLDNFEILATLSGQAAAWAAQRCTPDRLVRSAPRASREVVRARPCAHSSTAANVHRHRWVAQSRTKDRAQR